MAVWKGVALAMINLVIVGIAIGRVQGTDTHEIAEVAVLVWMVGLVPAALCGIVDGAIAGGLVERNAIARLAWLLPLPVGVAALLGVSFDLAPMVPWACVPTIVSVSILERWTRHDAAPTVPVARTRVAS